MHIIARIRNDFTSKFGIPRQSGLAPSARARIVFEPAYRSADALRGLEDFSHLWLIWEFSQAKRDTWSPTVRPPRLGGNRRMGVFATRSPFRPNPIGLSCVRLEEIVWQGENGPELIVSGADLMNGTPIFDIKPYLPYADCRPDAKGGFADGAWERELKVDFPEEMMNRVPPDKRQALVEILRQDPRPSYQNDPDRVYGLAYGGVDVRFSVREGCLTVVEILFNSSVVPDMLGEKGGSRR